MCARTHNNVSMKVVLDTNIIISGYISQVHSPIQQIISLWQTQKIEVLVSKEMLREYHRVFEYQKIKDIHKLTHKQIDQELEKIKKFTTRVEVTSRINDITTDPSDNIFLECAIDGNAEFVITGNTRHFTASEYSGIKILTPKQFILFLDQLP